MRRRRKNKSISFMTAVVVEVGAMLGIVAVAQPSWTLGLIEQVAAPTASAVVEATTATALAADSVQTMPREVSWANNWSNSAQLVPSQPPSTQLVPTQAPEMGWNQAAPHMARLVTPSTSGWVESASARIAPVLPPPIATLSTPPWGSGDGWISSVPVERY